MFSKGIAMHVPLILFHNPWNCTIQSILNDGKLVAMYHLFDSWSKRWIMLTNQEYRMQRVTNRDTRLIYICESWISLFINSPVSSRMYLFWKKISPLRIQHRLISHRMQLKQPLTRDFSRLRSLLRCRVDGPPMNAIRSRRSSKNVAHSHANDTRPRRINERHRCRASSRRSLIGPRGINRAVQCTRCPPISNPSPLEKKIR